MDRIVTSTMKSIKDDDADVVNADGPATANPNASRWIPNTESVHSGWCVVQYTYKGSASSTKLTAAAASSADAAAADSNDCEDACWVRTYHRAASRRSTSMMHVALSHSKVGK